MDVPHDRKEYSIVKIVKFNSLYTGFNLTLFNMQGVLGFWGFGEIGRAHV